MELTQVLLLFHLLGAFCFFAGGAVVGVLQLAAIRQERPSQVHAFLRLAPFGAALVGAGALLTLGFGIALAEHEGLGFSEAWIQAALGLWVTAMVLGAYGGRTARRARHLSKELAAEGDAPSEELHALVSARGPLWASYASFALLLAIVVLMVWQPGSSGIRFAQIAFRAQCAFCGVGQTKLDIWENTSLGRITLRWNGIPAELRGRVPITVLRGNRATTLIEGQVVSKYDYPNSGQLWDALAQDYPVTEADVSAALARGRFVAREPAVSTTG